MLSSWQVPHWNSQVLQSRAWKGWLWLAKIWRQVLPCSCQVLDDRDSSLQECCRKHILLYVGQFEFILTRCNCCRLYFTSCLQGLLEWYNNNECSHLSSIYTLTWPFGLTAVLVFVRLSPGVPPPVGWQWQWGLLALWCWACWGWIQVRSLAERCCLTCLTTGWLGSLLRSKAQSTHLKEWCED